LSETIVDAEVSETFRKIKEILVQSKCRLISQEEPRNIVAVQGSLWGVSPETAQKKIEFTFRQNASRTRVIAHSALTSGYINFTLAGCVLSVLLLTVCIWIGLDMQGIILTGNEGAWSWLAQTQGFIDLNKANVFVRLMWILTAFLVSTLALEALIIWKVKANVSVFAERKILSKEHFN
jgi:hypothetical protein